MTGSESAMRLKVCPMCAEQIQPEALVCRYCGYDYRFQQVTTTSESWNGFAIASMVLGIVWVYGVGSVLALIFGVIAYRQIQRSNGTQRGKGMAIAGIALGGVGLVGTALMLAWIITYDNTSYRY